MQKNFQNVRFQPGTRSISFRTGLTVYEESFTDSALIPRGWSTAGYPNDLLEKCQTRLDPNRFIEPQAFRLEIDGRACDRGLEFVSFDQVESDKKTHAVATLLEPERGIRIKVHTIIDGSPVFTRFLEIVNESDRAAAVSSLSVISGGIEEMDLSQGHSGLGKSELSDVSDFYELGYFDADGWGKEGDFSWHRLTPDLHSFCGRYQRDRYRHPVFFLRNKLKGTAMVGQLGWSGGSLESYARGCSIGGDTFGNREGLLPAKKGRVYTECDIDTAGKSSRGAKRIVFSNDGLIYYTDDHYESFTLLYGEE